MQKEITFARDEARKGWIFLLLALALLPLMISADSLWVDEAYNALFAMQHSFADFFRSFFANTRSENQMPLGMFASWLGGRILGTSEWELRAVNLVWGIVTLGSFYFLGRRFRMPWLPLFMAIQPFFWYYMNEARPYAMQVACGSLLLISCVEADEHSARECCWLPAFFFGSIVLCGSSLLGVIPFFFFFLTMGLILFERKYHPSRRARVLICLLILLLGVLGIFYLWTLMRGAGGAKLWKPGWENIAYAFYDFLGFGGLGPARNELRLLARAHGDLAHALAYHLPGLFILTACYMALFGIFFREKCYSNRTIKFSLTILAGTCVAMLAASYFMKWPFWGRHLSAIFPLIVFLIAFPLRGNGEGSSYLRKGLLALIFIMLAISAFSLRFSPNYRKDDYRDAAAVAREVLQKGGAVWWAADEAGAEYYGLIPYENPSKENIIVKDHVTLIQNADLKDLGSLSIPRTILLSKEDIYDVHGVLQMWMKEHHFILRRQLASFQIWSLSE